MHRTSLSSPIVSDRPVTSRTRARCGRAVVLALAAAVAVSVATVSAQQPGPETFGKTPTTPVEIWDAADYLVRTGQAAQAVPFVKKFIQSKPDDATLLQERDRFCAKSILRLQDYPD